MKRILFKDASKETLIYTYPSINSRQACGSIHFPFVPSAALCAAYRGTLGKHSPRTGFNQHFLRNSLKSQTGISLIELVAFIVIVSVAMVGLIGAYSKILARAPTAAQITRATQLAQERMELILSQKDVQGYTSLALDPCPPASAVCPTLPLGFIASAVGATTASAPWPTNPNTNQYRLITVTVTGPQGTQLTQLQSVLANY